MSQLTLTRCTSECEHCHRHLPGTFCNLSTNVLRDYETIGMHMVLPKGAILFQEGEPSHYAIVVCDGQVKMSSNSKDGKTLILKIATDGDVLGLGAVIMGKPYEVTAETLGPTYVKSMRAEDFVEFLARHGEASMHASQALSQEYKAAFFSARLLALAPSAAGRLAAVLLGWGRAAAIGKMEMRFTMALTHEDLASIAGTSRETVTRVLGKFQRDKLIQVRGASILITAPDRLAALAA